MKSFQIRSAEDQCRSGETDLEGGVRGRAVLAAAGGGDLFKLLLLLLEKCLNDSLLPIGLLGGLGGYLGGLRGGLSE